MSAIFEALIDFLVKQSPALLVAIASIIAIGWIIKQYYNYERNSDLFRNRLFQLAVLLVVISTAAYYIVHRFRAQPPVMISVEGKVRVVVLPFENLTDTKTLRDGMAWSLTDSFLNSKNIIAYNERSRLNRLISERGLHNEYGISDILSIAELIRADFVIWGTIEKYQQQTYHATIRLVEMKGRKILRPMIESKAADVFVLQENIFRQLIRIFDKGISHARFERGIDVLAATTNLKAYDYYITGRNFFILTTPEGYQEAIKYYKKAIQIDPKYSLAWAGLASAYVFWGYERSWNNQSYQEFYDKALKAARMAVDLDPSLSETHRALALVYAYWIPPKREKAEAEARKAIAINPNDYEAYFAIARARVGDEEYLLKAIEINPDYLLAYNWLSTTVYSAQGRINEAIKASKKILELNPKHATQLAVLASLYIEKGMIDEAIQSGKQAITLKPDLQGGYKVLGIAYYRKQSYDEAEAALVQAVNMNEKDSNANVWLALVYEKLGETTKAIRQWERTLNISSISEGDVKFAKERLRKLRRKE